MAIALIFTLYAICTILSIGGGYLPTYFVDKRGMNPYVGRMRAMLIFACFPVLGLLAQPMGAYSPWWPAIIIGLLGAGHQAWSAQGYGIDFAGKAFGVLRVEIAGQVYEVALTRSDSQVGVGHKGVVVNTSNVSFYEDSVRRDFTCNAMYLDVHGQLYDYHDGTVDIKQRQLEVVSSKTFGEDPLRALRGARFAARFDWKVPPGPTTLEAVRTAALQLNTISVERLRIS